MNKVIWNIGFLLSLTFAIFNTNTGNASPTFAERIVFEGVPASENVSLSIVEAFEQDKYGFIWIGARDGLYRYDGINYIAYTFHREDEHSLSNNVVSDLFRDSKGQLWVATENGLNLYDVRNDNFIRYTQEDGLPDYNIRSLIEDEEGRLWVSTRSGGIVWKDPGSNHFTGLADLLKGGEELLPTQVRHIYLSKNNTLWIGTVESGVKYLSLDDMILKDFPVKIGSKDLSHSDIRTIGEDQEGNIWFGSNGDGLVCYIPKEDKINYYSTTSPGKNAIGSNKIWDIKIDRNGLLWVATDGGGLLYLDQESKVFSAFTHSASDAYSIASDAVRVLFEDKVGNFWIGHYSAPMNYVNRHPKKFFNLRELSGEAFPSPVTAILRDSEGDFWYGTDGSGLILDRQGEGSYTYFKSKGGSRQSVLGNKPMCLEEDVSGNIWIGYFEGGISYYDKKQQQFTHYPAEDFGEYSGNQVWDLMLEGDTLWIASKGGLHHFNLNTREFSAVSFGQTGNSYAHKESLCMLRDSKGRLLFGTYSGLYVYTPGKNNLQYFESSLTDISTLSDQWITTLFEDSEDRIWIGTNNGLNLWKEPDQFTCFTMDDGLVGNTISGIVEDPDGKLWISTNRGITCFNSRKFEFVNYTFEDGLQGVSFRPNAFFCIAQTQFYFGGDDGISFFNPSEIQACPNDPPIVLTGLKIIDRRGKKERNKLSLKENILTAKEIHIYPGQNIFTIDFASLNYTLGHRNQYEYMLEGFEESWQEVGDQHFATYTNLAPGEYIFRVKGSNHDGVWNQEGASIKVIVHSPFYKTVWFIGLLILIIVLLALGMYRMRVRQMRFQNTKLATLVSERTQELEKSNREIAEQNARIIEQRDHATVQRDQISNQKEELEKHRLHLEELVKERTQDLVVAKDKAEESDRLKTAFLENLSHEIRTPMNAIVGFINLLTEKIDDKFSRDYYLRIINDSGRSMLRLIQDIVDFSRMQTGQLQPVYSACMVSELLRDLVTHTRAKASREKPDLNIVANMPEQEIVMYTDGKKLNQIFSKLLENSIKYTAEGHITMGIEKQDEQWITFFVKDTGRGIKTEHIEKVFDRFFTVTEDDKSEQERGSGLGLAFAKVITELLGGKIWAESADGKGSTFYFMIPFKAIEAGKERSVNHPDEERFSWSDKKILVAEDEESNYLLIEAILKDTGVSLIHCEDGVELLEKIDEGLELDLVLLDLKMPRMGGINALKLIRESNHDVPVIVQTAYDQTNHRNQCQEAGCNDFLVKPLRKKELLETIEKYLDAKE